MSSKVCPSCGQNLPDGVLYCPYCGEKIPEGCPKCGAPKLGTRFCPVCGYQYESLVDESLVETEVPSENEIEEDSISILYESVDSKEEQNTVEDAEIKKDEFGTATPFFPSGKVEEDLSSSPFDINEKTRSKQKKVKSKKPFYKKWWFWLICGLLLIGIFAGGGDSNDDSEKAASDNPLMNCEVMEADVKSGSGKVIGTRAYIEFPRKEFDKLSDEQIAEFAQEVIDGADYNYFTIDFGDGTGVVFSGCNIVAASIGDIDETGAIVKEKQLLSVLDDGKVEIEDVEEEPTETKEDSDEDAVTIDQFQDICGSIIADSFGEDNYTITRDDEAKIMTINVWRDGIAQGATLAKAGNAETVKSWNDMTDNINGMCKKVLNSTSTLGLSDWHICVNIVNDANHDNLLYSTIDGVKFYDVMDD